MAVTKFSRQQIADACRKLGDLVEPLPFGVSGEQLLWAIAGNESSFGANCTPRHEPAYDVGGRYAKALSQAGLLAKYGPAAACSYGPMQVMLVNAPEGMAPADFDDCEEAMNAGVYALNNLLVRFWPKSIAEIGYCYNGGHVMNPNADAEAYGARLARNYAVTMPPEVAHAAGG